MSDYEKKEPLRLEAKKPETLKLVDTEPFWNGTDNYGKPKYGFKIIHISGADAMFVSDSVKTLDVKTFSSTSSSFLTLAKLLVSF